jgi:hypothetical protein
MGRNTRTCKKRQSNRRCRRQKSLQPNKAELDTLWKWFLPNDSIFAKIHLHGNINWTPVYLVFMTLCWAWSDSRNLTDAFAEAADCCQKMFGSSLLTTYQGFMGALLSWTTKFLPLLRENLHQRMAQLGGNFWRVDGWVPIAFDGSRSSAPRTASNEAELCAANYGKGMTAKYRKKKSKGMRRKRNQRNKPQPQEPQAWITMMWHMRLRLPWNWRLGPSNSSERAHVMEMAQTDNYPKNTLFCGDAGFVGYPLWTCLLEKGVNFLVRVGGNVSLLREQVHYTTQKKGKDTLVLCWPKTAMSSNRPPLRLRLVRILLGKTEAWMLTSVLEQRKLTAKAILRFYKMRWGIEVEFRGLKQTLERAKLRSRNSKRLLVELDWSILAMAIAELFALKVQLSPGTSQPQEEKLASDPLKRSLANTMRALRRCLSHLHEVPKPGQDLTTRLRKAVTDSYVRKASKRARYRPPNPDKKPLGEPKLRILTKEEQKRLGRADWQTAA